MWVAAIALVVLAASSVVLIGWANGNDFLTRLLPGSHPVLPATAVSMMLIASALYFYRSGTKLASERVGRVLLLLALPVLLMNALLFLGDLFVPGQIDDRIAWLEILPQVPPNSAVALLLVSTGLLLIDWKRQNSWPGPTLIALGGAIALFTILGHIYNAPALAQLDTRPAMAISSALLVVLLSVGASLTRPDRGLVAFLLANDLGAKMARRLLPLGLIIPLLVGLVRLQAGEAGRIDVATGVAVSVAVSIALVVAVIWVNANSLSKVEVERLQAQRSLEEIISSIRDVVWSLDADGRTIGYISPGAKQVLGLEPGALRTIDDFTPLVHPDDRDALSEKLAGVRDGGRAEFELRILHPETGERWVAVSAMGTLDERGQLVRIDGTTRDVTDRKNAEVLAQLALQDAERASSAKSEFLSRMSHELRTPLNSIIGFSQVMQLRHKEPQDQEALGQIVKAGRHLLKLINEILDIAAIEAGKLSLSLEPVSVRQAVATAAGIIGPLADQRRITTKIRIDESIIVRADHQRLIQVLLNLLSNAVKYNVDGGLIDISAVEKDGDVEILVADTGQGLTPERRQNLFVAFERLEQTGVEGTGLGLALSQGLVQAMKGKLTVKDNTPTGLIFIITLPTAEVRAISEPTGVSKGAEAAEDLPIVLYIEDNQPNIDLMEHIFQAHQGAKLIVATHGRLGLELCEKIEPALVLMDLHLPDISGEEVLLTLKKRGLDGRFKVVVISADATAKRERKLREMGVWQFLTKPLDVPRFMELVDDALGQAKETQAHD
jgi:PAS domain S-box-containing protein